MLAHVFLLYFIASVRIALQTWMSSLVLFSNPATLFTPKTFFICKSYSAKHQNLLLINFQFVATLLCLHYGTKPRRKSDLLCVNHSFSIKSYSSSHSLKLSSPIFVLSLYVNFSVLLDTFYAYFCILSVYDVYIFKQKGMNSSVFKARGYH